MKKEIDKTSFDYRRLHALYPKVETFYYNYFDGNYLETAYTEYYDDKGNILELEDHGYYG